MDDDPPLISGVWGIAIVLIFIIVIVVVVVVYRRLTPSLAPIGPGGQGTALDPVTEVSLFRGLTPSNPLEPIINNGQFVPIILPSNLPPTITDCAFYGNYLGPDQAGFCPAGSQYFSSPLGIGQQGCYTRPCPPGYIRTIPCVCAKGS